MYKLVCKSLPKSTKSIANYTSIYRKINHDKDSNYSRSSKSRPQSQPEYKNEEQWEEVAENIFPEMHTTSMSSFFSRNHNMKILTSYPNHTQFSYLSTRKSRNPSNGDLNKSRNYPQKLTNVAATYYNDGTKQCNKIKNKYRKVPSCTKCSWSPKPFKGNAEVGLSFMQAEKASYPKPQMVNLKKYETEDDNDFFDNNELLPKISLRRSPYQSIHDRKKFKIVYPANAVKHKMGLFPMKKSKRYKSFAQEKERNPGVPVIQQKSKKKVSAPKLLPTIQFMPTTFMNQDPLSVGYESSEHFQRAMKQPDSSRLITVHPILKKASYQNKMSIKKKYNILLLKQSRPTSVEESSPVGKYLQL